MGIDYRQIYLEFEKVKQFREYNEYVSELNEIDNILKAPVFDSTRASKACSYLAGKYEAEINQQPGEYGIKKTVVKGPNLPAKSDAALKEDLLYFQRNIPVFALKRELKSDLQKALLGL